MQESCALSSLPSSRPSTRALQTVEFEDAPTAAAGGTVGVSAAADVAASAKETEPGTVTASSSIAKSNAHILLSYRWRTAAYIAV